MMTPRALCPRFSASSLHFLFLPLLLGIRNKAIDTAVSLVSTGDTSGKYTGVPSMLATHFVRTYDL